MNFRACANSSSNWIPNQLTGGTAEFGLVVWFNFEKVYPIDHETKSIENVKEQVVNVLNTVGLLNSRITCERILERVENIYNGYSLAQYRGFTFGHISSPFMMRPYGVFRIEGTIKYQKNC